MASIAFTAGLPALELLQTPGIRINAMSGREPQELGTCTTIVGIGGAGGNLLNHMIRSGVDGACNHLYINCHLNERADPILARHQLNIAYRRDMSSDEIRTTCLSRKDEVLSYFMGAKAVLLLAGLGGGFGTSVTPIIARFARELGICVTAVVTTPFEWEGRRNAVATNALYTLDESTHIVRTISNDRMTALLPPDATVSEVFRRIDQVAWDEVEKLVSALMNRSLTTIRCG